MRRIELTAPPGKLGVRFTFTTIEGRYETTVGWVRPGSPMSGKLLPGDRVISVDGRATAGIDHHALAALIGSLAAVEKKLIIDRPGFAAPAAPTATAPAAPATPTALASAPKVMAAAASRGSRVELLDAAATRLELVVKRLDDAGGSAPATAPLAAALGPFVERLDSVVRSFAAADPSVAAALAAANIDAAAGSAASAAAAPTPLVASSALSRSAGSRRSNSMPPMPTANAPGGSGAGASATLEIRLLEFACSKAEAALESSAASATRDPAAVAPLVVRTAAAIERVRGHLTLAIGIADDDREGEPLFPPPPPPAASEARDVSAPAPGARWSRGSFDYEIS